MCNFTTFFVQHPRYYVAGFASSRLTVSPSSRARPPPSPSQLLCLGLRIKVTNGHLALLKRQILSYWNKESKKQGKRRKSSEWRLGESARTPTKVASSDDIDKQIELERQELKKRKPQAKILLLGQLSISSEVSLRLNHLQVNPKLASPRF